MSRQARPGVGQRAESRAALWMLAPAIGAMAAFLVVPVAAGFVLSLTDFDVYAIADPRNARFVGLANYAAVVAHPDFWRALVNTGLLVVVGGPLTIGLALCGALLVHHRLTRLRGLWRTAFFAPVVTTLVAVAVVWRYLYHPRFGLLNAALGAVGLPTPDWLGDPRWALPAIILLAAWRSFGYGLVIFVAGLAAIPASVYEAAALDGAGAWQQFRRITLPLLAPTVFFVAVVTTVGLFQTFAEPYVMTRGGPARATVTIALLMYEQGFRWWRMGLASAIAFILFGLILAVTAVERTITRRRTS